ncbi:MAG: glutamate dehydrogenase [Chlamydiae bacterium]|nr:glutamate dehydrogenase [Chlamydiota bacterium]
MSKLSKEKLISAISQESKLFEEHYLWLEKHMPPTLFEDFEEAHLRTITHNLMGLHLQNNFIQIHFPGCSIVLCLDNTEADVQILKHFSSFGIKHYQTYISDTALPQASAKLRIAILHFTKIETQPVDTSSYPNFHEHKEILEKLGNRFLRTMNEERLQIAIEMFQRAQDRDNLQYEMRKNEDWKERQIPSLQIVFAWKNTPKYNFLYRLAKMIYRHNLVMTRVNSSYIDPYSGSSILVMSLAIHGQNDKAAWEVTDLEDFFQELCTLKYFEDQDLIERLPVSGNMANFLRSTTHFVHQFLLHLDNNVYSAYNIEEGICRHPELTELLCEAFEAKFHPKKHNILAYEKKREKFLSLVSKIDTGNITLDTRRQNILFAAMNFVHFTLKTNFYRANKSAHSFRLDPLYLDAAPYERKDKFPELPYAIFFMKGRSFIGFHIRFKELSRGGLRTIFPYRNEQAAWERINIFSECYNLAYTQQKKNKDIPEGGAKGVIFIEPFDDLRLETQIYQNELLNSKVEPEVIKQKISKFQEEQRLVYLYHSQRSYVHSLLTLINCEDDGTLKAKDVVDYWKKPEYIYLGPDENMHNCMIEWIAEHAKLVEYKPGKAFISSKPKIGINHKEYGVTSLGVNVYMHKALESNGINPNKDIFRVKISGGPDGDVAGNQIYNLYRFYPNTARLLAVTDGSGTIYDPIGLSLDELVKLFKQGKPISHYPPEKLHSGGFLLDILTRKDESEYQQLTLFWKKEGDKLEKNWLSGNEWHQIYRQNVHKVQADVFIPAGGRPRTLNAQNYVDYLDPSGIPTSKAIVEGANLYLTPEARKALEDRGVLIFKDSSCNKGGVICSSLEVSIGLILSEEEFLDLKQRLMPEILAHIEEKASLEANLLLRSRRETNKPLTELSDLVSKKINTFTYQILDHLMDVELPQDPKHPLILALLDYHPPLLKNEFSERIIKNLPDIQKKATIASHIASKVVYQRGLSWSPNIVDVLPLILKEFK